MIEDAPPVNMEEERILAEDSGEDHLIESFVVLDRGDDPGTWIVLDVVGKVDEAPLTVLLRDDFWQMLPVSDRC